MAEAIFNYYTKDIQEISSCSCGLFADGVSKISKNARDVLSEIGIESSHISSPISEEKVKKADFIIGMTANHARTLVSMFPDHKNKIYTMPKDISDPYGCNIDVYRECRNQIEECIKVLVKTIVGEIND